MGLAGKSETRCGHHSLHADHKHLFSLDRKAQNEWFPASSDSQPPPEHTCSVQQFGYWSPSDESRQHTAWFLNAEKT